MSLASSTSDSTAFPGDAETTPDRVVRVCSKCARPLSVGERMFYFLEAVNAPALCRLCVLEQERELLMPPEPLMPEYAPGASPYEGLLRREIEIGREERPSAVTDSSLLASPARTGSQPGVSGPTFRATPSLRTARTLRAAASRYVEQDRIDEAFLCLRELAFELSQSESIPEAGESPSGERTGSASSQGESARPQPSSPEPAQTDARPPESRSPRDGSSSSVPVPRSSTEHRPARQRS